VLGDSRRAEQRNSIWFAHSFFSPDFRSCRFVRPTVSTLFPLDYVAESVSRLHQKLKPMHEIYHLSSGTGSETFAQLTPRNRAGIRENGALCIGPGLERSIFFRRELVGRTSRKFWPQRVIAESFHAVSGVDNCVLTTRVSSLKWAALPNFFAVLLSVAAIQPRLPLFVSLPGLAGGC